MPGCAHCIKMKDEWLKLAEKMSSKVNLLSVNGEALRSLPSVGEVKYYPSIYLYQSPSKVVEMNPDNSHDQSELFDFNFQGLLKFLNKNGVS